MGEVRESLPRSVQFDIGADPSQPVGSEDLVGIVKRSDQAGDVAYGIAPIFGLVENHGAAALTFALEESQTNGLVDGPPGELHVKGAAVAATTGAQVLATDFENGDTIDGVVLVTGDRVLVKDQAAAKDNGIYVVKALGAPDRAADMAAATDAALAYCFVAGGTVNAGSGWVCTTASPAVVGTDDLTFTQYAGDPYVARDIRVDGASVANVAVEPGGKVAFIIEGTTEQFLRFGTVPYATSRGRLTLAHWFGDLEVRLAIGTP
jgi:hypothetical protein